MSSASFLSEACREASIDAVLEALRRLVPDGTAPEAVINARDDEGRTALHWAVAYKSFALAEQLLAAPHGATPFTEDEGAVTPLMSACAVRAPTSLTHLLATGGPAGWVDKVDEIGNAAIHLAASQGDADNIGLLLTAGANPLLVNKRGQTVLHRCTARGAMDCVEAVMTHVKAKHAAKERRRFLDAGDARGDTALHYAAMENNRDLGEMLLRFGASRDVRNKEGREFWEL